MMQVKNLSLAVPGKSLCSKLSMEIQAGQCWAILGANGAGKSTLLHALSGAMPASSGEVFLLDKPIFSYNVRQRARHIGILFQEYQHVFYGTVWEYVLLGWHPHASFAGKLTQQALDTAELAMASLGLSDFMQRRFQTLSGGERQRARIAQLLVQAPQLFFLDEPLQHLDLRHQQRVLDHLKALAHTAQKAVVMVLHDALLAGRYCDHVLLLYEEGRVLLGPSKNMLTAAHLQELYQCPISEVSSPNGNFFVPV